MSGVSRQDQTKQPVIARVNKVYKTNISMNKVYTEQSDELKMEQITKEIYRSFENYEKNENKLLYMPTP